MSEPIYNLNVRITWDWDSFGMRPDGREMVTGTYPNPETGETKIMEAVRYRTTFPNHPGWVVVGWESRGVMGDLPKDTCVGVNKTTMDQLVAEGRVNYGWLKA